MSNNIYWKEIPAKACVIETKHVFVVKQGRKRSVAYWMGQESREAQLHLKKLAKKGCK